ncbi:MAG TPA: hypothetical protein VK168_20020 [Saprospiraceae bacterium]|nr:hypothetical protein [Saprospiraceae bacterium]
MKPIFLFPYLFVLLAFMACEDNDPLRITRDVNGSTAVIPWQDCAYFADHDLTVCFIGAKEERCPCNTDCLWEGAVKATFEISNSSGLDTILTLETNSAPAGLHYFHSFGNKTVTFVNTEGIQCEDYGQYDKYKVIVKVD